MRNTKTRQTMLDVNELNFVAQSYAYGAGRGFKRSLRWAESNLEEFRRIKRGYSALSWEWKNAFWKTVERHTMKIAMDVVKTVREIDQGRRRIRMNNGLVCTVRRLSEKEVQRLIDEVISKEADPRRLNRISRQMHNEFRHLAFMFEADIGGHTVGLVYHGPRNIKHIPNFVLNMIDRFKRCSPLPQTNVALEYAVIDKTFHPRYDRKVAAAAIAAFKTAVPPSITILMNQTEKEEPR
jgi:hypothetical protein